MVVKIKRPSMCLPFLLIIACHSFFFFFNLLINLCRYFNRGKLDYPNTDTTRASRKYVRAMKQLPVCGSQIIHSKCLVPLLTIALRNSSQPTRIFTGYSWTFCSGSLFTTRRTVSRPSKHCNILGSRKPLSMMAPRPFVLASS